MHFETLYLSTVFIAGVLSFFSPCVIPLLPVYFSAFSSTDGMERQTGFKRKKQVVIKSAVFVLGISTCFVVLGFGAGFLGKIIDYPWFHTVLGVIIILLGIHQTGLITIPWLYREKKIQITKRSSYNYISTYLLGLTFSFGWTPCIGPILGSILGLSSTSGDALYSVFLMVVYALGFLIPFLVLAIFSDVLLTKMKVLNRHLKGIKIAGGILIILMGILFLSGQLNQLVTIFT